MPVDLNLSVATAVKVSEHVTTFLVSVSVADSVATSEQVTGFIPVLTISVANTVRVSVQVIEWIRTWQAGAGEAFVFTGEGVVTSAIPVRQVSVADHAAVTQPSVAASLQAQPALKPSVADAVAITELPQFKSDIIQITPTLKGGFIFSGQGSVTLLEVPSFFQVGSGGFKLGAWRVPPVTVTFLTEVAIGIDIEDNIHLIFGGEGQWLFSKPAVFEAIQSPMAATHILALGGAGIFSFKKPPQLLVTGSGGFILAGTGLATDIVDTWVLSGPEPEYAASYYSNFPFNSFAIFRGQRHALAKDGLYLLDGETDDGQAISTGVRLDPVNFGSERPKRLRVIIVGMAGDQTQAQIRTNGYQERFQGADGKIYISRNIEGREFRIDLVNFKKLSQVEFVPLFLQRW